MNAPFSTAIAPAKRPLTTRKMQPYFSALAAFDYVYLSGITLAILLRCLATDFWTGCLNTGKQAAR